MFNVLVEKQTMKRAITIALMLSAFSICSFGQLKGGSDGTTVYRDADFPFSVMYPTSWAQTEPSHPQTRFKVTSEDGMGLTDFSVIVTNPKEIKNLTSSDFASGLVKRPDIVESIIKMGLPDAKLITSGKTFLSNRDAFFLKANATFRNLDESFDLTIYQILLVFEGHSYTLTFRALRDEFDDNFPIFKVMASSFVVRPKVTAGTAKKLSVKPKATVKTKN